MNKRKQYARFLAKLDQQTLCSHFRKVTRHFNTAKRKGSCALEAVLYFDIQQIKTEITVRQ